MGGWAEGLTCADPGGRTPISSSEILLSIIVPVYMWWVTFLEIWALRKHKKETDYWAIMICSIKSIMTFFWKYRILFVQIANILPIHRSFTCPTMGLILNISSSWVKIMLHTGNQSPGLPGSALKVCMMVWGVTPTPLPLPAPVNWLPSVHAWTWERGLPPGWAAINKVRLISITFPTKMNKGTRWNEGLNLIEINSQLLDNQLWSMCEIVNVCSKVQMLNTSQSVSTYNVSTKCLYLVSLSSVSTKCLYQVSLPTVSTKCIYLVSLPSICT